MTNLPPSHYLDIGVLGEDIVAQWLQSGGWIILHRRWRCRWGEIDIVAKLEPQLGRAGVAGEAGEAGGEGNHHLSFTSGHSPSISLSSYQPLATSHLPLLAFVEVKTRRQSNWDAGGLLAITPKKQAKLLLAAQYFLAAYPDLAEYSCRFDVALVSYHTGNQSPDRSITSLSSLTISGYYLVLQEYIPSAFD